MKTLLILLLLCLTASAQVVPNRRLNFQTTASGGGGSSFDPSSVSGYALDYDVDALGLSDGTEITSLTDKSANKFHLLADVGPYSTNNASYFNGKRWAAFVDQTAWMQTNFSTTFGQPNTVFAVVRFRYTPDTGFPVYLWMGGTTEDAYESFKRTPNWIAGAGVNNVAAVNSALTSNVVYLIEVHYRSSVSQYTSEMVTNGVSVTGENDAGTMGQHGFTLGCADGGTPSAYGMNFEFARLLFYNADVSGTDLTNIRTYCRTNYNIWTP